MSAARQVLLDLATRCETEEPSDELNWAIMEAIRPDHGQTQATPYGTSIDAAVTLMPADTDWALQVEPGDAIQASVWVPGDDDGIHSFGSTPALALCAASLRARAEAL